MEHAPIPAEAATETRARFTVAARPLADAVKLLSAKVTETRNSIPILSCLLIEAAPCGRVTLTGTDLDIMATVTLAADPSEEIEPGTLCLDADALAKLLAKVAKNSDRVRIEGQDSNRASLNAGRNNYKLPGLPRDDFPMIWAREIECQGQLDRAQFVRDLKALAPAVSTDESRYYLNGYAMQLRELGGAARFVMVAANGPNMAAASRLIPAGLETWADAILSRKTGAAIIAADKMAGEGETVTLSRFGNLAALELGAVRIVSKLIDGEFPDWQHAFGAACAPTEETEGALFPDMMPGRPLAQMDALAKAAPTAIQWGETETAFIGESATDSGLAWCCMKLAKVDEPRKGFTYGDGISRDYARDYLAALAASHGLPAYEAFAEACQPFNAQGTQSSARGLNSLHTDGDRVLGLTVGGVVNHWGRWETVQDWEALCERQVWIEPREEVLEGSYSILMPADGPAIEPDYSVTVEGDRRYPVAVNSGATQIHLSADQVRALVGDSVWEVLEFPGPDGKPRYVSRWLWDDGDSRLLLVGKDGRCPKAGAPRHYVTRAEVEAALAGGAAAPVMIEAPVPIAAEPVAACQIAEDCAEPAPMPADTPDSPECTATPVSGAAADDADPIAAVRARLAEIEAILAALPAQSARPKRTPAHERAIRRAWAMRKARREELAVRLELYRQRHEAENKAALASIATDKAEAMADEALAAQRAAEDAQRLAEQVAAEALAAREDMRALLQAAEARAASAEAENAQLWAEIEALTAPADAIAA